MTKILAAVKENDMEKLLSLAEQLTDLSHIFAPHGENLIHFAARNNNVDMLEYLFNKGVYINHRNFYNATPLYYAAYEDAKEACEWFVEKLADPRPKSTFSGKTAFDVAEDNARNALYDYAVTYEQLMESPYFHYLQKIADHYTFSMCLMLHPRGEDYCRGYSIAKDLVDVDKKGGLQGVIEKCKEMDKKYHRYLLMDLPKITGCLVCSKKTKHFCEYCKKVPICEDCYDPNTQLEVNRCIFHINACRNGQFK